MSQKLSQTAFANSKAFIFAHGRPVDQRLFEFHFEGGSKTAVLDALAAFQNDDGGFGNGLEADLRTPNSSVIATSTAFSIFRSVGATAEEPSIQRAVAYLHENFDVEREVWPIAPPEIGNAPHAFWWNPEKLEESFGGFLINPFASVVGHLWHYESLVSGTFLQRLTAVSFERLVAEADSLDMFSLACYIGLATAQNLPTVFKEKLRQQLIPVVDRLVEPNPAEWVHYNVRPLEIATSPNAFLAEVVDKTAVAANLDYLIEQQLPDGSWVIPWSWAAVDAKAWAQAEKDWKGHIAVHNLHTLKAYNRLAN